MGLLNEIRRRMPHVLASALGLLAIVYFAYHAIHGDRGVLAWRHLEQKVSETRSELDAVRGERQSLEHRVRLLHPESLDADMLDEEARRVLGYGRPDELVIFTDRTDREDAR